MRIGRAMRSYGGMAAVGAVAGGVGAAAGDGSITSGMAMGATMGAGGRAYGMNRMNKLSVSRGRAGKVMQSAGVQRAGGQQGFWKSAERAQGMGMYSRGTAMRSSAAGIRGTMGYAAPVGAAGTASAMGYAMLPSNKSPTMRDATLDQRLDYDRQRSVMRANINLQASARKAQMWRYNK